MADACQGAHQAGGLTVGLLPGPDHAAANAYVQIVLPTGIGFARNYLVAHGCHAMIALPGGRGTLTEMTVAADIGRPVLSWLSHRQVPGVEPVSTREQVSVYLDRWSAHGFSATGHLQAASRQMAGGR